MTTQLPSSEGLSRRPRWWGALRAWERAALVIALLGALLLSAALIYFRPGDNLTAPGASPVPAVATAGPEFPPGTRWYYQRGQWVPQDQQAPVQP
jgi:hypothetical protein